MKEKIVQWIRDYFEENGKGCNAIIGISGGKDSSICAALLVEALGKDRVIGILMPQGEQYDINMSYELVNYLGIRHFCVNIKDICESFITAITESGIPEKTLRNEKGYFSNTPARIRMTILYGFAALMNGRVANTCNKSEDYVGYSTKFGDSAGDFSILSDLTVREVKALGYELGLPKKFIEKIPEDGLSSKTDEENFGFTYEVLDDYIENGKIDKEEIKKKIDALHQKNLHKITPMPSYKK